MSTDSPRDQVSRAIRLIRAGLVVEGASIQQSREMADRIWRRAMEEFSVQSEIGAQTNSPAKRPGNPRVPPESCQEGAEGGCDDKSHTPRTDAHTKSWSSILNDDLRGSWVEADFARQLERELTGAYELLHRTEDEKMALRSATGATEEQEVLSKLAVDSGYERWWIRDGELFLERDSRDKPGFITVLHIDHLGSAFRPDR